MKFPRISIKTTHFELTSKLETIIEQKFESLGKLMTIRGDERCDVELEKVAEQNSGRVFRAEVNLFSGGKMFRAEATEEQMEQSIDRIRNELKHELQHAHGKRQSLFRRGRQAIKNMLRLG